MHVRPRYRHFRFRQLMRLRREADAGGAALGEKGAWMRPGAAGGMEAPRRREAAPPRRERPLCGWSTPAPIYSFLTHSRTPPTRPGLDISAARGAVLAPRRPLEADKRQAARTVHPKGRAWRPGPQGRAPCWSGRAKRGAPMLRGVKAAPAPRTARWGPNRAAGWPRIPYESVFALIQTRSLLEGGFACRSFLFMRRFRLQEFPSHAAVSPWQHGAAGRFPCLLARGVTGGGRTPGASFA